MFFNKTVRHNETKFLVGKRRRAELKEDLTWIGNALLPWKY